MRAAEDVAVRRRHGGARLAGNREGLLARFGEPDVRDQRAETAQCGDEAHLSQFLANVQVQRRSVVVQITLHFLHPRLDRHADHAKDEQDRETEQARFHSSRLAKST